MTNEEAKEIFSKVKELPCGWCYEGGDEFKKAINHAIKVFEERPQGEWESVGFVSMKYAWCRCSKCHKTTKIYLDSSNEFCCISDIRKKAVACLYCGANMRKGGAEEC